MRLLTVLFSVTPLVLSKCPSFLEGIDATTTNIDRFDEAVDTACGRRNYTSIFWSKRFNQQLIEQIVTNSSEGQPLAHFTLLFNHIQAKKESLGSEVATDGDAEAKYYFDCAFSKNRKMLAAELSFNELPPTNRSDFVDRFWSNPFPFYSKMMLSVITHAKLTPGAAIAVMQTMKNGFGVIETDEIMQDRLDTAMRAIERVGIDRHNEKLSELFARLYILVIGEVGIPKSAFEKLAEWAEHDWKSQDIGPIEIIPAAELLYLQFRSLKFNESRIFVDWILMSNVIFPQNETQEEKIRRESRAVFNRVMIARLGQSKSIVSREDVSQCFKDLPEKAREEIIATFPELFVYLKKRFNYIPPVSEAIGNHLIDKKDLEGSGFI